MTDTPTPKAILAIESSCDETALAVVSETGEVLGERLYSQIETHRLYGGVVPEVASRSHFAKLDALAKDLLGDTRTKKYSLTAVAATAGPGLVGPLIVGAAYGEGLAAGWNSPFIRVHHLRGHLASVLVGSGEKKLLTEQARDIFPALVLLVSGGHTQVLGVDSELRATLLAESADDAAGECFDKAAKLMGLPYPGGPQIEKLAAQLKDEDRAQAETLLAALPRPKSAEGFSFSGLKTAIRQRLEKSPDLAQSPAFCFAIQQAIAECLVNGLDRAIEKIPTRMAYPRLVFCGGVSANQKIRAELTNWAARRRLSVVLPPLKYCTDNAAMIAVAAWIQNPELALADIYARVPL